MHRRVMAYVALGPCVQRITSVAINPRNSFQRANGQSTLADIDAHQAEEEHKQRQAHRAFVDPGEAKLI